jgi:hydroxyacylglutathione hydrolase
MEGHNSADISILRAFQDNYIYLVAGSAEAVAIDPGEAEPVLAYLGKTGRKLTAVLLTHHHPDHVGGAERLQQVSGCTLYGPEDDRLPQVDRHVREGSRISGSVGTFAVLETPGHTRTHLCYVFSERSSAGAAGSGNHLFSGDTLFNGGCGRLFEGTAQQMIHSLSRLAALPGDTLVYGGHEYAVENYRFARFLTPQDPLVENCFAGAIEQEDQGVPNAPTTMAAERRTNPFLRVLDNAWRRQVDPRGVSAVELFRKIRKQKDHF